MTAVAMVQTKAASSRAMARVMTVVGLPAQEASVTGAQPDLRLPSHIFDRFEQSPVASDEFEADASR